MHFHGTDVKLGRCPSSGVYTGRDRLSFGDVEVFPATEFLAHLHAGRVF